MEGKLVYQTDGFNETNGVVDEDIQYINLARDLSALNRKGFEQTTRKVFL